MLCTTHVGSLPLTFEIDNIERAFRDLTSLGLDFPPVPQLRSFLDMFLDPLADLGSLRKEEGCFTYIDLSHVPDEVHIPEISLIPDLKRRYRGRIAGIRACVTGPFTLSSSILTKPGGSILADSIMRNKSLVLDTMVEYVAKIVKMAGDAGADMVVVDEPVLSVIVASDMIMFGYSEEEVGTALNRLFEGVRAKFRGFHVCNVLPPLVPRILLDVEEANVLDHEHSDSPKNYETYTREELESHGKYVAVGVVSSKSLKVENLLDVKKRVNEALRRFGDRLLFVKPDCGFLGLKGALKDEEKEYSIALDKLRMVVQAARETTE